MAKDHHLMIDILAGCQLAQNTAIKLLLTQFRGNQQALDAIRNQFEHERANMLADSETSEAKRIAFDETAESLIEAVAGAPQSGI